MGICRNCSWWGADHHNECGFIDTISADTAAKNGQKFSVEATALDDSGLECGLVTGPDFGCIHFNEVNQEQK